MPETAPPDNQVSQRASRVLIAMSGGVDSSVSTALLKDEGYRVEGAFIVTWTAPWLPCTWREERDDALRVAEQLDIPFHTIDLSHEYERDVVDYLVAEYKAGRTPNPDVMCNKYIKFGGLYDWAMQHGFDYLATGHYARVERDETTEAMHLYAGLDRNKDQSYFLWTLTQDQLAHTLFPIGHLEKRDVRILAEQYGLPTAHKKDSQGVCFLGKLDMQDFLSHYTEGVPGEVLDTDGTVIGTHDGALFYTLGQRHGFSVRAQSPTAERLYVVAKNIEANTITVAPESYDMPIPDPQTIGLCDVNWIGHAPHEGAVVQARLRYRQKLFDVTLTSVGAETLHVTPQIPQKYVPVGQSVVLYEGDRCLGGGVITE